MKQFKIAILSGDGIGPEVMTQAVRVLKALERMGNCSFECTEALVGGAAYDAHRSHLPQTTISLCESSDAVLFGSVGGPITESHLPRWKDCEINSILAIRRHFSFGINLRPIQIMPSIINCSPLKQERISGVDMLFVRELLGDVYFGERIQRGVAPRRTASDTGTYTEELCKEALNFAFQSATKRRGKVTLAHKANVLSMSKLWVEIGREVSRDFPGVVYEEMLVDNCAMQLVTKPSQFDVVVTSNLFGDILSDLGAALPGTLGLSASASLNTNGFGLYEPAGGSAPDISGKGIANPAAQILSAALMLEYSCGLHREAQIVRESIRRTYDQGVRTADLGGDVSTQEFGNRVIENII